LHGLAEAPDKGIPHDLTVHPLHRSKPKHPKTTRKIFLETLGKNISRRRGTIPLKDFARTIGISVHTLKKIEKGETEPRFDTLYRLAAFCGSITIYATQPTRIHIKRG
jgi:DNA-binding XRE family transcriptional regulator